MSTIFGTRIIAIIVIIAESSNRLRRRFNDYLHDYRRRLFDVLTFLLTSRRRS
ncbi:hypothetical protein L208DRAFT_771504 [Tricholoma matsutake]|nr:hypothetical protein L208DRAFT_771504 [Tricholoma matsutake 945]